MNWGIYINCLLAMSAFGLAGWLLSLIRSNVTHIDSMWSLFFLITAITSGVLTNTLSMRGAVVIGLVTLWAIRLSIYLTWRNWGPHEDHRYATIRKNNQPYFWIKSIYIVFGLQVLLAWLISISVYAAINSSNSLNALDFIAMALFLFGFIWEVIADYQLSKFKLNPLNKDKVLNSGLWGYSRHPNYFGETCIWWAFYLFAAAANAWWAIVSPLLMTLLLLKVSGVSLLEQTIVERRPAYMKYIQSTNAFFPGRPRN